MPTRSGYHRNVDVDLTARQRDVLRLIAQGKSNPEIADALGIGYESVKSYVSDVLSKLGVDRREEAAAWWQEEHSLRRRAARFGAGILALLPRGLGAAVTGAALLLVGAILVVVLLRRGDSAPVPVGPASETETSASPTAAGTPAASTTPAVQPTSAGTAIATAPSVVAGRPVRALAPGPPIDFPANVVLYLAASPCFNCGWGAGDPWRVYRGRDGRLVVDHITPPDQDGYVVTQAVSADGGLILAGICSSYCGGEMVAADDALLQVFLSRDGGITWQAIDGPALRRTFGWFAGWYEGEAVLNAVTYPDGRPRNEAYLLPSFTKLTTPVGLPGGPGGPAWATVGPDGALLWKVYLGSQGPAAWFDELGRPSALTGLQSVMDATDWQSRSYGDGNPNSSGVWLAGGLGAPDAPQFFVEVDQSGTPIAGYSTTTRVTFAGRLSATEWFGTATLPLEDGEPPGVTENVRAVLIDVAGGVIRPISDFRRDASPLPAPLRTYTWPRVALVGSFWRVSTGGDCLNVRQEPSTASTTLGCFRDGVLLRERDASARDGWRAVTTPDGRAGFAAADYLE